VPSGRQPPAPTPGGPDLLPIDTTPLRFLLTGEPTAVLDYETRLPRTDGAGRPPLRVPVVVTGTGEKRAPAVEVTVPGPLHEVELGSLVPFTGLALRTWSGPWHRWPRAHHRAPVPGTGRAVAVVSSLPVILRP
jgi:hypothetical protein